MATTALHPRLPAWVQRYARKNDPETYIYVDPLDLPKELQPLSVGLLPVDMQDGGFDENMTDLYADIPDQWRVLALLPFPVYTDLLGVLALSPEVLPPLPRKRTERLADSVKREDEAADAPTRAAIEGRYMHHATTTIFDFYTRYAAILVWLRAHRAFRIDEERAASCKRATKICEERLRVAKRTLMQGTRTLPGVFELMLRMREPGTHMVSFYSEELAQRFEPLLFRYAISAMRILQHQVFELCLIDPHEGERQGLLLSDVRPPREHLCQSVLDAIPTHTKQFAEEFSTGEKCFYDTQHIAKVQVETPPGAMNRSMLFQTLICIVLGKVPVAKVQ